MNNVEVVGSLIAPRLISYRAYLLQGVSFLALLRATEGRCGGRLEPMRRPGYKG